MDGTLHRMVGTKVDITERRRAEETLRENDAALQASNREIRHLAGSLITAQDVERARIARDLHDDVSQQLAALSIALSNLKRHMELVSSDKDLETGMSSIQKRVVTLVDSLRDITHDLHPDVLKHGGVTAALAAHCAAQPIAVTFTAEGDFESIDSEAALCLYRIAQEALHNVVKHARAHKTEVRMLRTDHIAELTIADDGQGFDVAESRNNGKGLGLLSISERVRLAEGTLTVVTEKHKGTQLCVRVPTRAPAPAQPHGSDVSERYARN
jgi:two-component system sensor histidine kinase UhpB